LPWLPWNIYNPNSQFSKARITTLNLNNFKKIGAVGLKLLHRVPLDGIISVQNFMKIYQAVQTLLVVDGQTDRQTDDFISLLSFLESRLKTVVEYWLQVREDSHIP
jgi:hypothetical protein